MGTGKEEGGKLGEGWKVRCIRHRRPPSPLAALQGASPDYRYTYPRACDIFLHSIALLALALAVPVPVAVAQLLLLLLLAQKAEPLR